MKTGLLYAFLGGALVGCAAAVLFAPTDGAEMRGKVKKLLRKKGVKISDEEVDDLVAELAGVSES